MCDQGRSLRVKQLLINFFGMWAFFAATTSIAYAESDEGCSDTVPPSSLRSFAEPILLHSNSDFPALAVQIGELSSSYRETEKAKTESARRIMESVLNSEELREKILNFQWNGKKGFLENKGHSNEEIYALLRKAVEGVFQNQEYVAEFNHLLYFKGWPSKEVGKTDYGQPWIQTNRKYYSGFAAAEVAGHLTHEWIHLMGFSHYNTHRGTVPYEIGYLVTALANQAGLEN